jgi:hypothetical protein
LGAVTLLQAPIITAIIWIYQRAKNFKAEEFPQKIVRRDKGILEDKDWRGDHDKQNFTGVENLFDLSSLF